jgi:hypothetical protein
VHIMIGWALTGVWSWSVMGSAYGGMLSGSHIDLWAGAFNLTGHVLALIILIAIPLEMTILFVLRNLWPDRRSAPISEKTSLYDLGLFACCLLAAMVAMTVYFSQSVYQIAPLSEKITRLHGRYYLYVLPMFLLLLLGLWRSGLHAENRPVLIRNLYLGGAFIFIAGYVLGITFDVGPIDFPDLTLFSGWKRPVSIGILLLALLALSPWGRGLSNVSKLIFAAIMWWVGIAGLTTATLLSGGFGRGQFNAGPIDAAFVDKAHPSELHDLVGRSDGVTVGTPGSAVDVFRSMFYLRSLSAGLILSSGNEFRDADFPINARWAVILPDVNYVGSGKVVQLGPLAVVWKN